MGRVNINREMRSINSESAQDRDSQGWAGREFSLGGRKTKEEVAVCFGSCRQMAFRGWESPECMGNSAPALSFPRGGGEPHPLRPEELVGHQGTAVMNPPSRDQYR